MPTLFLNPNSNPAITATLRRRISAQAAAPRHHRVRLLRGAPGLIDSAQTHALAERVLAQRYTALTRGFDRLVLMSSLDTGYETARRLGGPAVQGFTRGVLAWNRSRALGLHAITFDPALLPLYQALFAQQEHADVVKSVTVLPCSPHHALRSPEAVMPALRKACERLPASADTAIFVVGAVGLELAQALRAEACFAVIDPIADLLAHLHGAGT